MRTRLEIQYHLYFTRKAFDLPEHFVIGRAEDFHLARGNPTVPLFPTALTPIPSPVATGEGSEG